MPDRMSLPTPWPVPERNPYRIPGPARVLVLSDVHVPFHATEILTLALDYAKKWKPTHVLLNGDLIDFYAESEFLRNPKMRNLAGELAMGNEFLAYLRGLFPKAPIIYKRGNHEMRWDSYLIKNAPELFGLLTTTFEAQFPDWVIHVPPLTAVELGALLVLHGHEYRFAIQNPVNPARGLFLRTLTNALCGHFHQVSEHSGKDGHGKLLTTWSTGCLCELSPDWLSRNNWGHGFATVEVAADGAFDVQNLRVYKGKVRS